MRHMVLKSKTPLLTAKDEHIINSILQEENLSLTSEVIKDAVIHKYGSINRNHAWQISELYTCDDIPGLPKWDLRRAACAVAESYCTDHRHPEIDNLVHFVGWAANHLRGIPFLREYDQTGDFDPTKPEVWLGSLYRHLEYYTKEAEYIDTLHALKPDYYHNVLPGDGGESRIITSHNEYNAAKSGWYDDQAKSIRASITSPNITPSEVLMILHDYWPYYVTPPVFRSIGTPIAYCLYCAEDFPDTPNARKEFRHAVYAIHVPEKKIEL